ncbi:hypothetical protein E2P81_ATG05898 [Venturia nashicola]|nr:hypothetical protein E2P81_ATG05898 [Venturia nashicola]
MYRPSILSKVCFLILSLFIERGQADCYKDVAGNDVEVWCPTVACGAPDPPKNGDDGVTVIGVQDPGPGGKLKRELWDPLLLDNSTWPQPGFTYQVSPYYKPGAVLRECSGSVVTSYDTIHANLNGRGQTLFTTPLKPSATLNITSPAAFRKLINAFIAYDNITSTTFFIPSDTALSKSCSYTLAPGEARTLMNAQSVKDFVAYSPSLLDGAFFKAGNGEDITITVKADGTKYANNIKIVRQDIIVENGVVHIIDGLFSSPSTSCAGPPISKTVTVISTIYQQSTVYQPGPTIYQPGNPVIQGTNCLPAPTTTIYPGSCPPPTTTVFKGQGTCPAPTTVTATGLSCTLSAISTSTVFPTTCAPQVPGLSCTPSVMSTSTIFPTTCASHVPGSSCTPLRITLPPTGYPPPGSSCPLTSGCPLVSTSITTTTIAGPPGPTMCPVCPSGTTCSPTTLCMPSTTTSIRTSIVPAQPGPTSYITLSICPPIVQPPSIGHPPEDCDENEVPYGPKNPRPGWPNSAICSAMGGCGGSTSPVPAIPTTKPSISTPAEGNSGGGYGQTRPGRW